MVKEHHCPNCGPQACNASTSKIHTCGVCAAVWEEVLTDERPAPAPAAPRAPTAPPKPATPTPAPPAAPAATPAKPVAPSAATAPTSTPAPPAPASTPTPPTSPAPATRPATVPPPPAHSVVGIDRPAPSAKRLTDVVAAAKVKLCPKCVSDNLKQPSDYLEVQGRVVLVDSQSYRPHRWFADTGELFAPAVPAPAAKPAG